MTENEELLAAEITRLERENAVLQQQVKMLIAELSKAHHRNLREETGKTHTYWFERDMRSVDSGTFKSEPRFRQTRWTNGN